MLVSGVLGQKDLISNHASCCVLWAQIKPISSTLSLSLAQHNQDMLPDVINVDRNTSNPSLIRQ